jgi:integrase
VRRPRIDYESHATGLDRNEVGALLVAAGLASTRDHALISLLAINGLRVSEALGANIEALGIERGHRTLTVARKGGKIVIVPLAPRTARAIDLAIGERVTPTTLPAGGSSADLGVGPWSLATGDPAWHSSSQDEFLNRCNGLVDPGCAWTETRWPAPG